MIYIIITFIIYILIMAIINYYRSEVICYLGITKCPICNEFTGHYLKENGNHNVTFIECDKCYRRLQIAGELSIYDKTMYIKKSEKIPPPEKDRLLFNDIMKKIDTILQNYARNISENGEEIATKVLITNLTFSKMSLMAYAEENNYSKEYVIDFFDSVYKHRVNNINRN